MGIVKIEHVFTKKNKNIFQICNQAKVSWNYTYTIHKSPLIIIKKNISLNVFIYVFQVAFHH